MYQLYQQCKALLAKQYHTYKNRDFIFIIPLVLIAFDEIVDHYFWLLSSGGLPQSADSQWYIDYARNIGTNLRDGLDINDVLYFGYNLLLAALLGICKSETAVVFVQAVTASVSVILVYKIAQLLFNRTTAVIASVFYCKTYDITLWSMYILSDSFFVSLELLCVYLVIRALDTGKKSYKILFALTALYMLVFRPTGILTMAFIVLYILIRLQRKPVIELIKKHKMVIGGMAALAGAIIVYFYASHQLDLLIQSLQFNAKKVLYNIYAKGWIYDTPTPYDYFFRPNYQINVFNSLVLSFIINNWDHVLVIYGKRAVAFMGRWVWAVDLRTAAGIIAFADKLIPVGLFLAGTIAAIRNRIFKRASIVWLVIFATFAFCILIFIDWMYRYRLPSVPFIAMVAAYGAERILYGAVILAKKTMGMLFAWIKKKYSL